MARGLLCGSLVDMPSRTRGHGRKGMEAAMPLVDLGSYKGPLGWYLSWELR